ncbi:unnamed protein product [Lactuca virosa]|uniref:Retrotransposon Copia-like N-terminal domain-containing protein n=1 Tax=Lactuca virosa TaxID=75947 RepID=A0AAU9LXM8_9ASTR|nr:unnamed protein product [Lactuca virosa]
MAGSSSSDSLLSMNTILHLISNRLTSSNYLIWRNQIVSLLQYQNLLPLVDGSSTKPPSTIVKEGTSILNPELTEWQSADQRAVILLQASLSEEAFPLSSRSTPPGVKRLFLCLRFWAKISHYL